MVNKTSSTNNLFRISNLTVLKGSNLTHVNMLKLTEEASTFDCPTLKSQSWYVCTGTVKEDVFTVSKMDMMCAASPHHTIKLQEHCKLMK